MHNHAQHASVFILTPAFSLPLAPPLRRTVLALLMASCFGAAQANPALPQVVNGQATFNQQGNIFSITNTPNTIINWQSFSIHAGEITRFIQQNGSSAVLNRITGQDPSKILGSLESNGKVFLINPNGIVFGQGAKVDVNGLVASSLGMSNEDFLAGKHQFTAGSVAGGVSNAGVINAGKGGQVLLIAPNVENTGIITAPNGEVILAAGRSVQLADPGNPQLRVLVSAPSDQALNLGQIIAQGGSIGMAGALVGQRGVLNANSAVVGENGRIVLKASGKALLEAGSVTSATGAAGKGGEIRVLGEQVGMLGNAAIDASGATGGGTVLLGGDYQGKNADVQHARQVLVGKNVSVTADAVDRGDGGKVIVWGNDSAQVYGSISARGGAASGNGGLVETSGARALAVDGIRVDTRARSRSGKTGDWLLDPSDINVVAGSSGNGLQDAEDFSNVFPDASNNLDASLISGATSNVRLQASNNVTFMSDVNNLNAGVGLSVEAGNRISVNALIKTSNGSLVLTAPEIAFGAAGKADVGGANISLLSNAIGGSIALNGTGGQLTGSGVAGQQFQLQADNMDLRGGIDAGGVTGAAKVTLSATSNARAITLGAKPGTTLGLSNEDLNAISSATLHIGSSGNSAGLTASQMIDLPVVGGTAGVKNLELETAGPLNIDAGVTVHQGGGSVLATMAGSGSLSIGGAGGLHADTVQLTADHMSLAGAAGSLSGNAVLLGKYTQSGTIDIGGNAADTLTALGLSEAELKTISAANINIGSTAFMGTLRVTGALNLSNLPTEGTLQLRSGADMRIGAALTLPGNLRVGAASGIAATAAVQVGETFTLDGGAWSQSAASLPIFAAKNFTIANGSFLRVYGGDGTGLTPYRIADIFGLQGIGSLGMGNHYVLAGDIDASGTVSWNQNAGFAAIAGGDGAGYAGTFDGAGHVIGGLQINAATSSATAGVGLFGKVEGGIVRNVVLQGGSVAGRQNVGALVGMNLGGTLDNVSSSATVTGGRAVGGLAGLNAGIVSNAGASGYVTGFNVDNGGNIGGLVGENQAGASIDASYATGTVKGAREMIGGLVGNNQGRVRRSYATGSASGGRNIGGLVGTNGGSIDDAYASGAVGRADNADSILTQENMGGLVGESTGSVSHVFSSGAVHGDGYAGVGAVAGRVATGSTFAHGFYNADTSLVQGDAGSSSGLSSAAMKQQGSFIDFNFSDVWRIYDGYTTPMLKDFLKPLLVTASGGASSRVYDGMLAGFLGSVSYAGFLDGDTAVSGSLGYGNARNVGNYALTGLWSTKYDIDVRGATLAILPRALTVSLGGNKVYDAQLGFDNASFVLGNVVTGDTVRASGNVVFLDKNVGNGKAVHASGISLLDNSLGNYSLDATTVEGTASISARALTYGVSSGQNRIYDGSKQVNLNGYFEGLLGSDQVSIQGLHGYMSDKQVGNAKSVAYDVATGTLAGQDAGNYVLSPNSGNTTVDIGARTLNVSFGGVSKIYDGKTGADVTFGDNRIEGDVLTLAGTAAFGDKNAGNGKTVTVSNVGVSGTDANNYVLSANSGSTTANIAARTLDVRFDGVNKIYDGKTGADVTFGDNRIEGDVLTLAGTAAFGDKNAGNGKTVTVSNVGVSGTDANNYVLSANSGSTTANIAARTLDVRFDGVNKIYDGKTGADVTFGDNRIEGDVLTLAGTAAFGDKNAGNGKTVTVSNVGVSGTDAGNYVLGNSSGSTTANIAARTLDVRFDGVSKIYDGKTGADVTFGDNRIEGDVLTLAGTAAFGDKNAGNGKTVTVSNVGVSGTDAGNYVLGNSSGSTTANIAARTLDVRFDGVSKIYDGKTGADVTFGDNRIEGDVLTLAGTAAFGDKNAGNGKTVTVSNVGVSGTDANNYVLSANSGSTTANIAARTLDVRFDGVSKIYDGKTGADVTFGDNRIEGDVLTLAGTAAFGDKNAGNGKTVTVSNVGVSGTDANNYVLSANSGSTTANIAARTLDVRFDGVSKIYDGKTGADVTFGDNRIEGDVLTLAGTAAFGDKNAGINKTVSVNNVGVSGTDANNYVLSANSGSTTANIAARTLDVRFDGVSKIYDGKTGADVTFGDNRIEGDVLTLAGTAAFGDKNAGNGKTVTVSNVGVSGTDAGNYVLGNSSGSTTANIAARTLDVRFGGISKIYDGKTGADVTFGDNRIEGDVLTLAGTAAFGDKNAGNGKTVTVSNVGVSGTDAGNYVLGNSSGSTTANIAARTLDVRFDGVSKIYDGKTGADVTFGDNRIEGDVLTLAGTAAFGDKNAGNGKTVTVNNVGVSGTDAGNYVLGNSSGSTTANIAARTLDVRFDGVSKIYDGKTGADVTFGDNRIEGDVLTLAGTAAFGDKNAGTNKTVSVNNVGVSGTDAGNYVLGNSSGSTTANIAARTLDVRFDGVSKIYDGKTGADVTFGDNRIEGDVLTLAGTAAFGDKNAGNGKTVTVNNVGVSGTDAGNYVLGNSSGSTTANIAARTLDVRFDGVSKIYDGNTGADVTFGDNRIEGDVLTLAGTAAFGDKNAGNGKTVTVSNVGVSGTDANNYVLSANSGSTTANIAARTLDVRFDGVNKIYDGKTGADVTFGDNRIEGDVLTLAGTAAFGDKNAGNGKTVTVSNVGVSGTDAGNYVLGNSSGSTTANIAARTLDVRFDGVSKIYDGKTGADVTFGDNRIEGDVLTLAGTAAFGDKNAGNGKTVTVSNVGVSGTDAGNYVLGNSSGSTTANIAARTLDVRFDGVSKIYDGKTGADVTFGDNRIEGDVLTLAGTAAFGDKNAGINKTVSVNNVGVSGTDANNYVLSANSGSTTANIAARALTVSGVADSKIYDGATGATVRFGDDRIAGDMLNVSAAASFADKNVGMAKAVTLSGVALAGQDAGNYFIVLPTGLLASITPATLTLAGLSAANKVYDGTSTAAVSATASGVLGQDAVSVTGGSGSFADRNAGAGKLVTASGFRLAGADAGNYVLDATGGTAQATITQKLLSTWVGSGNGLWSDAANWDGGVVPEGTNVLAVDFSRSSGIVTYGAAAGSTTLKSLTSASGLLLTGGSLTLGESVQDHSMLGGQAGLEISGGNLVLNGTLSMDRYAQSGGLLGGSGNLLIANSFSQAAGAIKLAGQLAIRQSTGDLRFASLAARDVSLSALNGAIGQDGAVVATSLATQSQNGTLLDNAGNQVDSFSANNSAAGGIVLKNTSTPGSLALGLLVTGTGNVAIENTGGIVASSINANGGNVALTAHSPVTVNGAIVGNDIAITASTDVALADGAQLMAARDISLTAGRDISFDGGARVASGGSLLASAGSNVRFAGNASFTVPTVSSMSVLAKAGSITGTSGVRINRERADVTLLAPDGIVVMPDAIFLPATGKPVVDGSVGNVIDGTLSIIKQADRSTATLPPTSLAAREADDKTPDNKAVTDASDQSTGYKFDAKKTFCN